MDMAAETPARVFAVSFSGQTSMWCQNCQQDVPAIANGESARCARCGRSLSRSPTDKPATAGLSDAAEWGIDLSATASEPAFASQSTATAGEDTWLLDERLRNLQRRLHVTSPIGTYATGRPETTDWNPAFPDFELPARTAAPRPRQERPNRFADHNIRIDAAHTNSPRRRPSMLAWSILSMGLMAFVCGGVLLGWAFIGHRNDLWSLGMPIALVGQFGLLLGLVLQLDHLWQANRRTAETLDHVDERLREVNHATTLLGNSHSVPAQSFYAHLAEGAHPHLLLADLKGQLDLLATKMASR
jgi:hypothetical protein